MNSEPAKEKTSRLLSPEEMRRAIEALPALLSDLLGNEIVVAYYGCGCRLHPELWYQPMKVGTSWLDRFVRESLDQGIVVPGESDFLFAVSGDALELKFCHERDIHLKGTDDELIARFIALRPFGLTGEAIGNAATSLGG